MAQNTSLGSLWTLSHWRALSRTMPGQLTGRERLDPDSFSCMLRGLSLRLETLQDMRALGVLLAIWRVQADGPLEAARSPLTPRATLPPARSSRFGSTRYQW